MDDLRNLAAALSGLPNSNATYFEYECCRNVEDPWWKRADNVLDIVIDMMGQEKDTSQWITSLLTVFSAKRSSCMKVRAWLGKCMPIGPGLEHSRTPNHRLYHCYSTSWRYKTGLR